MMKLTFFDEQVSEKPSR